MTYPINDAQYPLYLGSQTCVNVLFRIDFRGVVYPDDIAAGLQPLRPPIYLCNCDRPISFQGQVWYPANPSDPLDPSGGIENAAVDKETGLKQQTTSLAGLLDSNLISAEEIELGYYNDATVTQYWIDRRNMPAFNWSSTDTRVSKKWRIGQITFNANDQFTAELMSEATYRLLRKRGSMTSRTCRYRLFSTDWNEGGFCNIPQFENASGGAPLRQAEWQAGHTGAFVERVFMGTRGTYIGRMPLLTITNITATNPVEITFSSPHNFLGPFEGWMPGREVQLPLSVRNCPNANLNGEWTSDVRVLTATSVSLPFDNSGGSTLAGGTCSIDPRDEWFQHGTIQFADPAKKTYLLKREIVTQTRSSNVGEHPVELRIEFTPSSPFEANEEVEGTQWTVGCDKSAETCSNKFDNSVNFGGEATLPGQTAVVTPQGS